ncbi:MAG: peptide ABC transporter substrate-binding protein [Anaerolineae bacterium]|nr:peptide ABC transporter substrate-binding protein [Anaerolineae bacterium]
MFNKALLKFPRVYIFTPLLLTVLIFFACAGPSSPPTSTPTPTTPTPVPTGRGVGDTLRILYWQAPEILNPHLTVNTKDQHPSRVTYEPLASFDKDGRLIPFLAAEIPTLENGGVAADGKSVTWKLKQGVRWSDGEPFTADDVLFTYEFITNPATGATTAGTYEAVAGVEVMDDYTVKVNFKEVNPAWSLPFVGIPGMILPRHVFEPYNGPNAHVAPANVLPIGTGPYRVIEPGIKPQEVLFLGTKLIPTNKIVYEPNPYFREEDKPYFRRVILRGGGTVNEAARSVLKTNDVDYAWYLQVDPEQLAKLEAEGEGKAISNFGPFVEHILLNHTDPNRITETAERSSIQFPHPFLSDKKVRQAFTDAVDRETIAALYTGSRPTSNILVAPANYNSPHTSYEFNLTKAAQLLDEAGWVDTDGDGIRDKDGVKMKVVFLTTTAPVRQQTQRIIEKAFESMGVDVELQILDSAILFNSDSSNPSDYHQFPADMMEYADGNLSPDPGTYMRYWTCDQIPQQANNWTGENIERWCNPAYDALYQQSTREVDFEKRQELFINMNDLLIEEAVLIPLVHSADVSGVSPTLEGVDLTPWDADLWNIKDWRRSSP